MKYKILYGLCLSLLLLMACRDSYDIPFKPCSIHHEFPVPVYAKLIEDKEYVAIYEWEEAEEIESIPNDYFIHIIESGWKELTELQQGVLRVFTKDDTIIGLTIRNGYFTISILSIDKEDTF